MSNKALLIAYAFPPVSAPEAYLAAKTLGSCSNYAIDVICAKPHPPFLYSDSSLDDYVQKRFGKIVRLSLPKFWRVLFRLPLTYPCFSALSLFPDRAIILNASALRQAEALKVSRYDTLITWSQFHSSHLVGLELKRRYPKLRWVAHFSDPWVDNPFNRLNRLTRFSNRKMEAAVIARADKIVFTTQHTVDLMMGKYPKAWFPKSHVVPHPYDPELYSSFETASKAKITFTYVGKFYGPRNPITLFQAISLLKEKRESLLECVQFVFVGSDVSRYAENFQPIKEYIVDIPTVSYLESLSYMKAADVLMTIDAPAEKSVFLPSKLVDYLGTQRALFGITPPGTSSDVIRSFGGVVVSPTEPRAIAEQLEKYLTSKKGMKAISTGREAYRVDQIASQMDSILCAEREEGGPI